MKYICPLITVRDIKKSKTFYEDLLGLKILFDFGENIQFEGGFSIHLKQHFENIINKPIRFGENNIELYFEYNELESIHEKLKDKSVQFVHDIIEQPWRQKAFRFYDPDGYIIEIGESMNQVCVRLHKEGLNTMKISESTSMPIHFVEQAINDYRKLKEI